LAKLARSDIPTPKLICTNLREKESAKTFIQTIVSNNIEEEILDRTKNYAMDGSNPHGFSESQALLSGIDDGPRQIVLE
jgi:hypothetical protein